jgi:hypothetical protein
MAQLKKPLEWRKIIMGMVNDFYKNYMDNIGKMFSVPQKLTQYYEKNEKFKDIAQMKEFIELLDSEKNEWKTFGAQNETAPVYFQLVFINACNVLESLKANLTKEEIKGDKIEISGGIDVIASTAMHMLATFGNELVDSYKKYDLVNDQKHIFDHATRNLVMILNQNAQEAFSKLLDNMMLFNQTFRQLNQLMAEVVGEPGTEDRHEGPRAQLYIAYSNAFILNSMMLTLLVTYPFENGKLPEPAFNQMKPVINLF